MGGRVEGKVKKKSIKANVTSKFSSKRKLSRMGKKVKKGQMGPNTEYITRSSALKRLQITLKDFRRLCILKGIYPRVPSKGLKGNDKIYYDIKDISYIMHEPLLQKFREFKTFLKKVRKAAGRNQLSEARRKDELKPKITLNHLVKERYPRFIDALRDLDDALCMIHLFAALPSAGRVTAERTTLCSKLVKEWQYYVSKSRSLHKVFVSVKGVYFQAEILGEPVTWLVPHQFTQAVPKEVDLRVMLTFLEFYEIFIQFVLFKLYSMQNMVYPPAVDTQLDSAGCFLLAINDSKEEVTSNDGAVDSTAVSTNTAKVDNNVQKKVTALVKNLEPSSDDEEEEMLGQLAEPLSNAFSELRKNTASTNNDDGVGTLERDTFHLSSDPRQRLFSGLVFFVNREVPLEWMQLCTVSFGAKVGWDGPMSPIKASDPRITHHIIDRPQQAASVTITAENNKKGKKNNSDTASDKDNTDQYPSREYIQPQWVFDCINAQILLPVANYRVGSTLPPHLSPFVDDEKEGYLPQYKEELQKLQQRSSGDDPNMNNNDNNSKEDADSNSSDSEEGNTHTAEESNKRAIQDIIHSGKRGPKGIVFKPTESLSEGEEAAQMSQIMMSKKTKRLYGRMKHGIQQKQENIETLKSKRQKKQ